MMYPLGLGLTILTIIYFFLYFIGTFYMCTEDTFNIENKLLIESSNFVYGILLLLLQI